MEEMCLPCTLEIEVDQLCCSVFMNQSFHTLTPTMLGLPEHTYVRIPGRM